MRESAMQYEPKDQTDLSPTGTFTDRVKPIQDIMRWFTAEHLEGTPRYVADQCTYLAAEILTELPDDPELTAGLRKLLEAKDCFVRAAITIRNEGI